MTSLSTLIERLQYGSGEDRELDFELWWIALRDKVPLGKSAWRDVVRDVECTQIVDRFTGSLDAALAFAEAVLPGWRAILYTETNMAEFYDATLKRRKGIVARVEAPTLARAVCAATLRALQIKETRDGE